MRRSASSSALHVAGGGRDGPPGAGLERCGTGDEGTQASGARARCSRSRPGQSRECARPRSSWRRGRRCRGNGPDQRRSPAKVVGGRSALASRKPGGACTATEPGFVPRCHNVDGHLRKGHHRFPPPSLPCGTQYQSTEKKSSPVSKSFLDLKNIQSINPPCLLVTLKNLARPRANGLTPRAIIEAFAAIQMVDVHLPTTDGRHLILPRHTVRTRSTKFCCTNSA